MRRHRAVSWLVLNAVHHTLGRYLLHRPPTLTRPKPLTRPATLLAPPLQEPDAELLVTMLEAADELLDIAEGPKLLPLEEVGARGCRACAFLV